MKINAAIVLLVVVAALEGEARVAIPAKVRMPPSLPGETMNVFPLGPDNALRGRVATAMQVPVPDGGPDVALFLASPPLAPNDVDPVAARQTASSFFNSVLGPSAGGETRHELAERLVVARQRVQNDGTRGDVVEDSSWYRVNRFVGPFPIYGVGSVASLEIRGDDIVSAVIRWDRVSGPPTSSQRIPLDEKTLVSGIERAIPDARFVFVDVLSSPELVYYDDRNFLYPAYRVVVSVNRFDGAPADTMDVFIPAVNREPEPPPPSNQLAVDCNAPVQTNPAGMRLDRYALTTDGNQWIENGYLFVAGLTLQGSNLAPRHFCFLEEPMLLSEKSGFIDSSHIALIESHGLPGRIQVLGMGRRLEWVDVVNTGGYGAGEESLRLLILHSCEVIQTADDDKSGWDAPWRKVFGGLHTVLGYRTTMSISDGVSIAFARHLYDDKPMIRSWFAEIASANRQALGASPAGTKKTGRGAAITVCGHDHAKRRDLARLDPTCLESFWFKD